MLCTRRACLVATMFGALTATAEAQSLDVVPGGWSSQVGSQPFLTTLGYDPLDPFAMIAAAPTPLRPSSGGVVSGFPTGSPFPGMYASPPVSANALVPFSNVVRQSVRRRTSR